MPEEGVNALGHLVYPPSEPHNSLTIREITRRTRIVRPSPSPSPSQSPGVTCGTHARSTMNGNRELPPLYFEVPIIGSSLAYVWSPKWTPVIGVSSVDLTLDVRAIMVGGGNVSLKPAIQFAPARTDRPDEGALITAGSGITANGLVHYLETIAAPTKTWMRTGVGYLLTSGTISRAQGVLYGAVRQRGELLPAEEVVFQPTNDTAVPSIFPLGGGVPIATAGVELARATVILLDNLNNTCEWRLVGRAFSDPLARGAWVNLMSGWQATGSGDSTGSPSDISLSGLSLSGAQWFELGFAARKATDGSANSRCIFHVTTGVQYT